MRIFSSVMGTRRKEEFTLWEYIRYNVVPPVFVVFFTIAVQFLAAWGRDEDTIDPSKALGNAYSWKAVLLFALWAFLWLKIPSKKYEGPPTLFGYKPVYSDNGVLYYWASLVGFFIIQARNSKFSATVFENMSEILGTLNIVAFLLCIILLVKGKLAPECKEKIDKFPLIHEFYRGIEIHPRLLGVDVKQLTNCRIGMMAWQLLIIVFFFAGVDRHGFNMGFLANLLLQSIFVAKFFWWETGYFSTLDITLDRAGYYICWGCLVWVPCFYTFSSYYLVTHPPQIPTVVAWIIFLSGIGCILLNYQVDYEKEHFRKTDGQCKIWNKQAEYIEAEYKTTEGVKKSKLLVSGFWGTARHMNYVFEILSALCWCLPGWGYGVWAFLYVIFLTILLVHRVYRDEDKCAKKYGAYWKEYCNRVKYRMIPYVY